jgi:predicted NAD/FAD-binding protein
MRIAVIGAGVSGLVAAHTLRADHDVTVLEAGPYAGGHTNTIDVDGGLAVDTGFIVLNDRNYPAFSALLAELGVATQPSDMSFGVSDGADFEYAAHSPAALYANRRHLVDATFQRMVGEYVRFNRAARELLRTGADPSLAQWLRDERFSRSFIDKLIVPQAAAVWSADPEQMWTFPARFLVEFFDNHGMLGFRDRPQWRTVTGGSREYVRALVRGLDVRLNAPVSRVERREDHVDVDGDAYDEIVIATHADQALRLLADPTGAEREILGAIPFQSNEAVLHTDTSLMPRRRRAWASWNYHLDSSPGPSTVTYWMNRLQRLPGETQYFVTLNRTHAIDPAKVIRTISYAHPVFTSDGMRAQRRHGEISGVGRTHYCGAYWAWGFHEDGVQSGLRAARAVRPEGVLA